MLFPSGMEARSLLSDAYMDLRQIEAFLALKLQSLPHSGRSVDSSLFLRGCAELHGVLARGLEVIEGHYHFPVVTAPVAASERGHDGAFELELELELDGFLLEPTEELVR